MTWTNSLAFQAFSWAWLSLFMVEMLVELHHHYFHHQLNLVGLVGLGLVGLCLVGQGLGRGFDCFALTFLC